MQKSVDQSTGITTWRLPEPPAAPSPTEPAPVVVYQIDWNEVGLKENKGKIAFVIDNALTQADCAKLLKAAEDSSPWKPAAVHGGPGDEHGTVYEDYRKSSRIILDSFDLADFIFSKLKEHIPEEAKEASAKGIWQFADEDDVNEGDKLELGRLNERLRYLKYVEGDFFESHCDGVYWTPDLAEISRLTLQLYLNGSAEDLEGGATRFLSFRSKKTHIDVDPRPGRALIFQQTDILHCGAEVIKGEKYTIRTDLMYKKIPA